MVLLLLLKLSIDFNMESFKIQICQKAELCPFYDQIPTEYRSNDINKYLWLCNKCLLEMKCLKKSNLDESLMKSVSMVRIGTKFNGLLGIVGNFVKCTTRNTPNGRPMDVRDSASL
jgi:hypothetical protein